MLIEYFSVKGKRKINEDYTLSKIIDKNISLHIVSDGMGGYENGKLAAKTAAESICTLISQNYRYANFIDKIYNAVEKANNDIAQLIEKDDYGKIRHIVTRSIQGTTDRFIPDFHTAKMQVNDKIIICSDGVMNKVGLNSLSNIEFDSLKEFPVLARICNA